MCIRDSCDTVVFLGGKSTEINEMVSKRVGKQTVKVLTESDSRGANRSITQYTAVYGVLTLSVLAVAFDISWYCLLYTSRCV